MKRDGLDLYERGGNIAFSNLIYLALPAFEGQDFFDEILSLFQKMMISRSLFDHIVFFNTVLNHSYKYSDAEFMFKFAIRAGYYSGGLGILTVPKNTLNLAVTAALALMNLWRKDIKDGEGITLIHDKSTQMLSQKSFWDALVDPAIPIHEVGYDRRKYNFPIAVTETFANENSKEWAGLQIADLLAGAAAEGARWLLDENRKNEGMGYELDQILNNNLFHTHSIWPSSEVDPEVIGTGEKGGVTYDKISEMLARSKNK